MFLWASIRLICVKRFKSICGGATINLRPNLPSLGESTLLRNTQEFYLTLSYPLLLRDNKTIEITAGVAALRQVVFIDGDISREDKRRTTYARINAEFVDRWDGFIELNFAITRGWDIFDATKRGAPTAGRTGGKRRGIFRVLRRSDKNAKIKRLGGARDKRLWSDR